MARSSNTPTSLRLSHGCSVKTAVLLIWFSVPNAWEHVATELIVTSRHNDSDDTIDTTDYSLGVDSSAESDEDD
eukprot:8292-Heterococcus_DN1.PRE.2